MVRYLSDLSVLAVVGACAPKTIPPAPAIVSAPKFPDFVPPVVPPGLADTVAAANQTRGWSLLQAGDLKGAEREFGLALMSSGAFYPAEAALGYVALARKDARAALPHFDRAVEQQHDYVPALIGRGETLLALNRQPDALDAFEAAVAADPSLTDLKRRVEVLRFRELEQDLAGAREAVRSGRMDEAVRAIGSAAQITRADLAALIGVRLALLLQAGRRSDTVLITDLRDNWAAPWILAVARAGVMEPYVNHAFQPRTAVRRIDLAQAVNHLLERIAPANPVQAKSWQAAGVKFSDISAGHIAYPAASAAIASGVMSVGVDNSFQPSRPVSGPEVMEVIGRI